MKKTEIYAETLVKFLQENGTSDVQTISKKTGIAPIQIHGIFKKLRDSGKIEYTNKMYFILEQTKPTPVKNKVTSSNVAQVELIESTEVVKGKNQGRDFSKLTFRGEEMRKGKLALTIVKTFCAEVPNTLKDFEQVFSKSIVRGSGFYVKVDDARKINSSGKQRYFTKKEQQIKLSCGTVICISNQISKHNIGSIIDTAKTAGLTF